MKGLVARLAVFVVGVGILLGVALWWAQALSPPIQTGLAVEQLTDSDAAHVALRTYEQGRNTLHVVVYALLLLWTFFLWLKPAHNLVDWLRTKFGW